MSRFLSFAVAMVVASSALAQDLYTITSQTRTVTARTNCYSKGCQETVNTASAPDNNSWAANVSASSPPSTAQANAVQGSTIAPTGFSGSLSAVAWSGIGSANATSELQITFTPQQRLRFTFSGFGFAPFLGQAGAYFYISGAFNGAPSNIFPLYATGILVPGVSYTFGASTSDSGNGERHSGSYTLSFFPADPPADLVAGPFTCPSNCHRYHQLAPSSWLAAEDRALLLHSHLVTINDAAEQTWLQSTFANVGPANKWIGMRALASNAQFIWASGQSPSYTHWAPGRPDYNGDIFPHFGYYPPSGLWSNGADDTIAGGIVEFEGCRCDWDFDGSRTSSDFFAFLNEFFASNADFNCSGATTSDDFFEFLACFFADLC